MLCCIALCLLAHNATVQLFSSPKLTPLSFCWWSLSLSLSSYPIMIDKVLIYWLGTVNTCLSHQLSGENYRLPHLLNLLPFSATFELDAVLICSTGVYMCWSNVAGWQEKLYIRFSSFHLLGIFYNTWLLFCFVHPHFHLKVCERERESVTKKHDTSLLHCGYIWEHIYVQRILLRIYYFVMYVLMDFFLTGQWELLVKLIFACDTEQGQKMTAVEGGWEQEHTRFIKLIKCREKSNDAGKSINLARTRSRKTNGKK